MTAWLESKKKMLTLLCRTKASLSKYSQDSSGVICIKQENLDVTKHKIFEQLDIQKKYIMQIIQKHVWHRFSKVPPCYLNIQIIWMGFADMLYTISYKVTKSHFTGGYRYKKQDHLLERNMGFEQNEKYECTRTHCNHVLCNIKLNHQLAKTTRTPQLHPMHVTTQSIS